MTHNRCSVQVPAGRILAGENRRPAGGRPDRVRLSSDFGFPPTAKGNRLGAGRRPASPYRNLRCTPDPVPGPNSYDTILAENSNVGKKVKPVEFEAAIGSWVDGYMSISITLERTRLSYTNYSETVAGFPHYEHRDQCVLARDLTEPLERERVREFFAWMLEHLQSARDVYPAEARFARGSAAGGLNWTFILWTEEKTYITRGRSGCPPWWEDACARISEIVNINQAGSET